MKLIKYNILVFLAFSIFCVYIVKCQNGESENSFHDYDLIRLYKKYAEHVNTSHSLKLLSEEDINLLNGIQKFLPVSINPEFLLGLFEEAASDKCVKDLKYVFQSCLSPGGWAMKMLDSYGKPGSGILLGNLNWLGEYDECVGIQAPLKANGSAGGFRGKYCTLQVSLKFGRSSIPVSTAICLPDSCNPNGTIFSTLQNYKLNGSFSVLGEILKSAFNNATLTCKATSKKLTTGAIVIIFLLSIFAVLALTGSSITAFEYFMKAEISQECENDTMVLGVPINSTDLKNKSQGNAAMLYGSKGKIELPAYLEKWKPFLNCFCIFTNGEKLLNVASSEGQLPCLHGIRFLSMTWVILCHTYGNVAHIVKNTGEAADYTDHWTFQIILNGFFCVDSFFVLSGFLVGYLFLQQAQKTDGEIPWLYFYVHRYVRLTPVYMIVVAFYTTISPFLGSGPLWPDYDVVQNCKDNWWWNLLYINNFQSINYKQCMSWSWFLANDMQFYVVSPLFLISLWRWPKIGYSLVGLFFSITFVCNFALTYKYDLMAGFGNILEHYQDIPNFLPRMNAFYDIVYSKPYTRIGSYLVGLFLPYYIYRRKCSNSPRLNWVTLTVGWLIASGITLTCQFGLYHRAVTTVGASFYNALSRIGFSMGLGWVIFVCVIGQGGVVNRILSWKALIPLSRLTYCAYLLHPIVATTYSSSVRTFINFNHVNTIMLFLGYLIISYAVSMVTSLLFESPLIRLEKLIRNKSAS
ncbi:nose resistant to fluoxetine protein 6-like [Argiope bruennichi]|uniref:nose resistant to fluoxetine protein 6-like n=1 Tax=Argiope bruennichi TaxID=94029 RepID=UPI002494BF49|nr:nose resistant to fluoxetine protein 6-like [Argiope bruennichi]